MGDGSSVGSAAVADTRISYISAMTALGADSIPDEADALLALAGECSLSLGQARGRIAHVIGALDGWELVARKNGVPEREVKMMAESISLRLDGLTAVAAG